MKKFLITTTINKPTEAVALLSATEGWEKVAVGDKKTPNDWHQKGYTYLSPETQTELTYETAKLLPWNLPSRAVLGFLYAMEQGATVISQVDDDNIPYGSWDIPAFEGTYSHIREAGFVNIYKYFTDSYIWPRGLPLDKILAEHKPLEEKISGKIAVWQHLADQDTDVDAIYRLTQGNTVEFTKREPLVLSAGAASPFNCQSTTYDKVAFPLMYLPSYISPRESDIVRGLIAQPIMWCKGLELGFTEATVRQERNPHNYLKDFAAEVLIYLHSEDIFQTAKDVARPEKSISDNLRAVYRALVEKKYIPEQELPLLEAWLSDVARLTA